MPPPLETRLSCHACKATGCEPHVLGASGNRPPPDPVRPPKLVKEAAAAGDQTELVFDGAGVKWVPALRHPDHDLHSIFEEVRGFVAGACEFCANAFEVKEDVRDGDISLLSEFEGHPSLRQRIADGFQLVTF